MQFNIGGQTAYSDALWNNHLIGQFSSQGMPDTGNSINSTAHNFVYDVYFFGDHISTAQALEFDINQFVNGQSFIWGARVPHRGRERMGRLGQPGTEMASHGSALPSTQQSMEPPDHPSSAHL